LIHSVWPWIGFVVFVMAMLAIDLGVFNRKAHEIKVYEAARWSAITAVLAMIFASGIWWGWLPLGVSGGAAAMEFITGYIIELALSVDNIFVFVLLFSYFKVPPKYQHRVLFWGVLGALGMRGAMIGAGALLIERFAWVIYVFGAFLVFTGIRMATQDELDIEPESNPALKLVRRILPVSNVYDGQHFFVRKTLGGRLRWEATPLFVVLVLVETTDLIFAVDSIPAIFAVTKDPFLVFTSNVFAILCLRSLYFLLAGVIDKFHYLKLGLSVVLVFIGVKMLVSGTYHIPITLSLLVVAGVLTGSVVASLMFPKELEENPQVAQSPLELGDDPNCPVIPPEGDEPHDTEIRVERR
jgi:tellurite resistance protein TerC